MVPTLNCRTSRSSTSTSLLFERKFTIMKSEIYKASQGLELTSSWLQSAVHLQQSEVCNSRLSHSLYC